MANTGNYLEKLEKEIQSNQSKVSLLLGALIIIVIGVLIFNYLSKSKPSLGPAQQTQTQATQNVSPNQVQTKYTVKEGDTLYAIADKYYKDGNKYPEIAKANNLTNPNLIEAGQVFEIPQLAVQQSPAEASFQPTATQQPQAQAMVTPVTPVTKVSRTLGTGGGNSTIWGPRIFDKQYTVVKGDWLSKIAGRAYGNIFAYNLIAKANHILNPNLIKPGLTLTIPR